MGVNELEKPVLSDEYFHENDGTLILSESIPLVVDVANIDQYPNEQYAMLRKDGLGASDSSIILGVNPYSNRGDLIAEKCRTFLTEEEKAVGDKTAVRKGRDLEPLIITKFQAGFQMATIKPVDMYRHKDYPWLKMNFDGVTGTPEQYIPAEIKVVTKAGEKHYEPGLAFYSDVLGFALPKEDPAQHNWSIETKAAYYGIPPYYYTQLQQQILGLNAPYGYLSVLFDTTWHMYTFMIWRDETVLNNLIVESYKVWNMIEARRKPNWRQLAGLDSILMAPQQSTPSGKDQTISESPLNQSLNELKT